MTSEGVIMERCADCYFYRDGLCRKGPPTPVYSPEYGCFLRKWPEPSQDEWCGEFKPKVGKGEVVTLYRYGPGDHFTMSEADASGACAGSAFAYDAPVRGTWVEETP